MPKRTHTSAYGVSRREAHDSSSFYKRGLYREVQNGVEPQYNPGFPPVTSGEWVDRIYNQSSERMPLPDCCVALAFTSPPYNVGKEYDSDLSLTEYLEMIERVGKEVHRVLRPGGRYVINIANLGRRPYIPLHYHFYRVHLEKIGFQAMGEIIWQKGRGASSNCAWGSWRSARAPRLRDVHEYLLVFAKGSFSRPEKGESDLNAEEFMEATLSVWNIRAESARKVGHPAPFPLELAARVIRLYSYHGDVVLDPFVGSGTTCVAAKQLLRHYVGFDISLEYCAMSESRLAEVSPGGL